MINSVSLTGRLTRDPELRYTQNNKAYVNFTIAVDRGKDQNGERQADFIQCSAWNKTAEVIGKYLHKGSLIGVEGRIQTRNYENQQGQKVYVTEVLIGRLTFLESKQQNQSQNNSYGGGQQYQQQRYDDPSQIGDDDLPF